MTRLLAISVLLAAVIGSGCAAPASAPPGDKQPPTEYRPGAGSMM
ncbi:MAG TPA: hypothetical protein VF007_02355 [Stellaceae bacterium]